MRRKIFTLICMFICSVACLFGAVACKNQQGTIPPDTQQDILNTAYLSDTNISLKTGDTYSLKVGNATAESWSSDDAAVATVEDGTVTAISEGITFIRVKTTQGISLSCLVTVSNKDGNIDIELSAKRKVVVLGDVFSLSATVFFENEEIDTPVTWSVESDALLIEPDGNVVSITVCKNINTYVYATIGSTTKSCYVEVSSTENVESNFTGVEEKEDVPTTQIDFANGVVSKFIENASNNVSISEENFYGESLNNKEETVNSLVLYGTLNGFSNTTIENSYLGYMAYGVFVRVVNLNDNAYASYNEKYFKYYAALDADENGEYGVYISDVIDGYYRAYAFVEYERDGEIIIEISENSIANGNLKYKIVDGKQNYRARYADGASMDYGEIVMVNDANQAYTDEVGTTVSAAYKADIKASTNWYYSSPKFAAKLSVSRAVIYELLQVGYSKLSFNVCYQTVNNEGKSVSLELKTLNLEEFEGAKITDKSSAIKDRQLTSSAMSNRWYIVEMPLDLVYEYYEVLFAPDTNYPLCRFALTASFPKGNGGTLLISEFSFEKSKVYDLDETLPAVSIANSADYIATIGQSPLYIWADYKPTANQFLGTETIVDKYNISKEAVAKFSFNTTANHGYSSPRFGFSFSYEKNELQELLARGYFKASVWVYIESGYTFDKVPVLKTPNYELMINGSTESGLPAFVAHETAKEANKWTDSNGIQHSDNDYYTGVTEFYSKTWTRVELDLRAIVEYYDVFNGSLIYPLITCEGNFGATYGEVCNIAVSDIVIEKDVQISLSVNNVLQENENVIVATKGTTMACAFTAIDILGNDLTNAFYMLVDGERFSGDFIVGDKNEYRLTIISDIYSTSLSCVIRKPGNSMKIYNSNDAADSYCSLFGSATTNDLEYKSFTLQGETKNAYQYTIRGKNSTYTNVGISLRDSYTKAELQALVDAGYKTITFSVALYYDVDAFQEVMGTSGNYYKVSAYNPEIDKRENLNDNGYYIPNKNRPQWHTITIDLQGLIDDYDAKFGVTETSTKKATLLCNINIPQTIMSKVAASTTDDTMLSLLVTDMIFN